MIHSIILYVAAATLESASAAGDYTLTASVIANGGGRLVAPPYAIEGVIGQSNAASMATLDYVLVGGVLGDAFDPPLLSDGFEDLF